jgi:hypothetical protein
MIEHQKISERGRHRRASQGAMSIRAFCETYDIGRTKVYAEINAGRLKARKAGTRTIIGDDDAEEWWRSLPAIKRDFSQGVPDARCATPGANAESQANSNIEPGEEKRAKRPS